jgi:ferric-dicitrate binding protein FerR (iron transport regulator)
MDQDLLTRYITGECTEAEARRVEAWAAEDPTHRDRLEELKTLYEGARRLQRQWDVDAAWARIQRRLPDEDRARSDQSGKSDRRSRRSPGGRRGVFRRLLPVVAAAALLAAGYWLLVPAADQDRQEKLQTVSTRPAERARIQLTDGTTLRLNVDSRVRYPAQFAGAERTVYLDGEAYFEVQADSSRPFRVVTERAVTQVRGTAFVVKAYDAGATQVAVRDGQVEISSSAEASPSSGPRGLTIEAGQLGRVDSTGRLHRRWPETLHQHFGWLNNRLTFEAAPLRAVARRLERWYDIEVQVADPKIAERRLSATFEGEPLAEVLDAIRLSLRVQCRREGRTVTFSAGPPGPTNR